jgi:hypothetical protein
MSAGVLVAIILVSVLIVVIGIITTIVYAFRKQAKDNYLTQRQLTDRELLRLIAAQPDGIMTAERLALQSGLNKKQAKSRLTYLQMQGMFDVHHSNWMKGHYSLKEPLDDRPLESLSEEPFLTVEDILLLFKHHDYQLTYQKLCMSTGLPISVIKEELQYFIKEKIITKVQKADPLGMYHSLMFLLEEPYRSNTDKFLEREHEINLELEKIYIKEIRKN